MTNVKTFSSKNINLNKVIVTGWLVDDMKYFKIDSGKFVNKGRIAINKTYKGKDFICFIDVEIFSEKEKYTFKKGQHVYIEGRLVSDEWEKDGKFYTKTKIIAFNIIPTKMSGSDINTVFMSGRLVKDPVVVKISENKNRSAVKLRLAVNRYFMKDGEWEQVTEYIDVVHFGTTEYIAKLASKISKGKFVYIQGFLKQESWETQAGEKRSKIVVVAEQINISNISKTRNDNNEVNQIDIADEEDEIEIPF